MGTGGGRVSRWRFLGWRSEGLRLKILSRKIGVAR